jgi:hypothetical protein
MSQRSLQLALLVAGAAVPLAGVLTRSWSLREVVVLYWAENVVIGVFQLVKIVLASPPGMPPAGHFGKLFMAPFFAVHYGLFCFVHGIFVFALTGGAFGKGGGAAPPSFPGALLGQLAQFPKPFWLALALIAAQHLHDTIQGGFRHGGWRQAGLQRLMSEPYKHIVVVHLGIILGAFLSLALGNAIGVLLIIVLGKFLIDLRETLGRPPAAATGLART